MMADYDRLYMQRHEFITGLPIVQPWKENDDDVEYLLATPKREAADAMYEIAQGLIDISNRRDIGDHGFYAAFFTLASKAEAVLALADG